MPSYQNYSPSNNISKELLNRNRVLTMSNNRKCDYLIVDVSATTGNSKDITTMMGINTQGNRKDILILKTFVGKSFKELVDEAYWLCNEFNIQIVLADSSGLGLSFIEQFDASINPKNVSIKALNGREIYQSIDFNEIKKDLQYGNLRFLQSPELAMTSYVKPFLGLSNIMEFHRETDKLIDEINNIKIQVNLNGNIQLSRIDDTIGKSIVNCLLAFYSYPISSVVKQDNLDVDKKEKYYIAKRMSQYEVIHGTFYKYVFKCIENNGIKVLFYHNGVHKIKQFQNIVEEEQFRTLFLDSIKSITRSKDHFEIMFHNGSSIRFSFAGDSSRGIRYHYAVVDNEISREIYNNIILPASVLFDMNRESMGLKDIYNIETVEMDGLS